MEINLPGRQPNEFNVAFEVSTRELTAGGKDEIMHYTGQESRTWQSSTPLSLLQFGTIIHGHIFYLLAIDITAKDHC
jgi:hypothetical protein